MDNRKNKLLPFLLASGVLNILLIIVLIFTGLVGFGATYNAPAGLPSEFSLLNEAYSMLSDTYVNKNELDSKKLSQGAVRGMMEAVGDPYSVYVDPDSYKMESSSFRGKYEGIGAYLGSKDKQLIIIAPMPKSPAEEAGLKPGDVIVKIDDVDASKYNLTEAALKIQGTGGTKVKLLLSREGESKPFEKILVRREIKLDSVYSSIKDNVAYIQVVQFLQNTGPDLYSVLAKDEMKNVQGIILDLRGNGGGLLDASVDVVSQFLSQGDVVDIVDNLGKHEKIPVKKGGIATQKPLLVLVNKGSASASEITAGALQDYGRGKLVGEVTFGKGIVQTVRRMSDGSGLHITTMEYLTPLGRHINKIGLKPDMPSDLADDALVDWAVNYLKTQK